MIYQLVLGEKIFNSVKEKCSSIHVDLPSLIEENLSDVEKNGFENYLKELYMQIYSKITSFSLETILVE